MKDFDKNIKQTLDRHNSPVDTDKLWESIKTEMDAPHKPPSKPWMLPLSIVAGFIIATGLWYGVNAITAENDSSLISENDVPRIEEAASFESSPTINENAVSTRSTTGDLVASIDSEDVSGDNTETKSIPVKKSKTAKKTRTTKSNKNTSSANSINKSKKQEAPKSSISSAKKVVPFSRLANQTATAIEVKNPVRDLRSKASIDAGIANSSITSAENNALNQNSIQLSQSFAQDGSNLAENNMSTYSLGGYNNTYNKKYYANPVMNADRVHRSRNYDARKASASEARAYNKHKEKLQRSRYSDLPKLPVIAASRSTFTRKGHRASDAFKIRLSKNDCPTFPVRNAILFADFGVGLSLSRKSFSNSGDMAELYELRNLSESPLLSRQARLSLGIKHKSGLAFMAGVSSYNISERFEYPVSTIDSTYYDGELTVIITIKDTEQNNSYKLYDIPLTAEYTRRTGKRWSSGIQLGVIPNVALKTKGIILNPNETSIDIAENQSEIFKPRLALSYYASVSANYLLSDNYYIYFSPYARVMPESFTQSSYGLDQNYELWGANIGLRYFFGKGDF